MIRAFLGEHVTVNDAQQVDDQEVVAQLLRELHRDITRSREKRITTHYDQQKRASALYKIRTDIEATIKSLKKCADKNERLILQRNLRRLSKTYASY